MDYGTIKTDVHSHNKGVAQEYYRYEVITRYWKSEDENSTEWRTEWKHNLIKIDRDGSAESWSTDSQMNDWFSSVNHLLHVDKITSTMNYYAIRDQIASEHALIVRAVMG